MKIAETTPKPTARTYTISLTREELGALKVVLGQWSPRLDKGHGIVDTMPLFVTIANALSE